MKKIYRLKSKMEIDHVFKVKKVIKNDKLAVHYTKEIHQLNFKFAISIGRKYGSAVERNLIKRRIRQAILQLKDQIPNQTQFVVVVYPKANTLTYQDITNILSNIIKKITEHI